MKQNLLLKIIIGITAFALVVLVLISVVVEPWVVKKVETSFNSSSSHYRLKIDKVNISLIQSSIDFEKMVLTSTLEHNGHPEFTGEIESISLNKIKALKALFKKEIDIREIKVLNSRIMGKVPFPEKARQPKISGFHLKIDQLVFDQLLVAIKSKTSAQSYSVKNGFLKAYNLQVAKLDTLSPAILKHIDFEAKQIRTVTPDSMYTLTSTATNYSGSSNTLSLDSFSLHPNYTNEEFTARLPFQSNRFEVGLSAVLFHNFSIESYLKSKSLLSSYIEIGKMDVSSYRDKRIAFRHVNKPTFQDAIYSYPGSIHIDSIGILSGNITHSEHAEKANEPGFIDFNQLKARIYKITNDSIYQTEKGYLVLKAEAMIMDKGKMTTLLKARIFDRQNTFSVNGTLSEMEVMELNPILEKSAFIMATSGKIDVMKFSFTANNTKAVGQLNMLYHELNLAVINKETDDTTALKEQIESLIANLIIIDSNPLPEEVVRVGLIDKQRDPERFLFHYCFKAILSGIVSLIAENPIKKEKQN